MSDCPDRGELQRLIEGDRAPDRHLSLEGHLEACERCRRLLEALADVRGVVPDRPTPGRGRSAESPALRRATEQLPGERVDVAHGRYLTKRDRRRSASTLPPV